jgi:putative nucleotidyltransferase with HDIG domain
MSRMAGGLKRFRLSLLQRYMIASFLVMLLLGLGIATFLGQAITDQSLASARESAFDTLHWRLLTHVPPNQLVTPMTDQRYKDFDRFIRQSVLSKRVVRVKVWDDHGTAIYSSDGKLIGQTFPISDELDRALHGEVASEVSNLTAGENKNDRKFGKLLEVYMPIQYPGRSRVLGAFEIYQDYAPVGREIAYLQHVTYMALGGGLFLLYLLLFGIVRSGSKTIEKQQAELQRHTVDLEDSYRQTIASLAAAVDARDHSTERHAERVTELAVELGRWMGLTDAELHELERGALLHDVGKIGISDTILLKPGDLTDEEWAEMRKHPEIGFRMLRSVSFLEDALPVVLHHHERWDGTGYPDRMRGSEIPLSARLFAVVDAYDAITADRPYRSGSSHEVAMSRIRDSSGSHFDPDVVAVFDELMEWRESGGGSAEPGAHPARMPEDQPLAASVS